MKGKYNICSSIMFCKLNKIVAGRRRCAHSMPHKFSLEEGCGFDCHYGAIKGVKAGCIEVNYVKDKL